jgi:pyrophosphate--fructose-6-phosphate 1-phosphotransferase
MKLKPEESSGSAQVNNIETERLLAELVGQEMKRRKEEPGTRYNKSFAPVCFYLGYQARSSLPTLFDCALGTTLGYTAGLLIKEGLTGYAATVSEVCKPQTKWSVGGVPLCALARPTPEGKVMIQPNLVDLNGETFREFSEQRRHWEITDSFINPGPIQYDLMTRPKTVIADIAFMGALRQQVLQMCDQIKASCGVGVNADYLHTAKESLSSLQRVLAVVAKYDVFAEASKFSDSVVTRHEPLTNLYASNKNPRAAWGTEHIADVDSDPAITSP